MDHIFDQQALLELARTGKDAYRNNDPFPHIVIDDFLPSELAEQLLAAFPGPDARRWGCFDAEHEIKLEISDETQMPAVVLDTLHRLNSSIFIDFLEEMTGIDGLIPDPHFMGGGLHQIEPGGYLNIHVDFNHHTRLKLDRRLNLLIYLNKNWKEEYNGHLELWDREMTGCRQKIAPIFNRCVIFSTTDFSYHGHPEVLQCPPGTTRKSLALYYYSNGRPAEEVSQEHSTVFKIRPGEDLRKKYPMMRRLKRTARRLVPPIIFDIYNGSRRSHY